MSDQDALGAVKTYWEAASCGEDLYLPGHGPEDYEHQTRERYRLEPCIPVFAEFERYGGQRVLEIGVGVGADHQRFAEAGAKLTGIDLTERAISHTQTRLGLIGLTSELKTCSAENLDFPDDTFDLVFSHGVLHHVPKTQAAQREIHRVLKPGGGLVAMLYARGSLNYQLSIKAVCRVMLAAAYPLRRSRFLPEAPMLRQHLTNAETQCLRRYLAIDNVTHRNSDGPLTPTRAPTRFGRWPRISRTSNWSAPTRATCLLRRSRHAGCVQERASLLSLAPENLVDPRLLVALIGPLRQYGPATMDPV